MFDNIISYILFASVLAYIHFRVTENRTPLLEEVSVAPETVTAVALPVVLVVGGLIIWYANIPGIQTSQTLIRALMPEEQLPNGQVVQQTPEDILETYREALAYDQLGRQEVREQLAQMASNIQRAEGVDEKTKNDFGVLALREVEKEVARNPESARLRLFAGSLYGIYGYIDKAEETYRMVQELSPTKQAGLFQLGEVLLYEGKNEEALEVFKQAYELDTRYDEAARLYAVALIRNGKDKEAVDLVTKQYGSPYTYDDRLFGEWVQAKRFDIIVPMLEEKVAQNPDDLQQKVSLAAAYKEVGEVDKAVALLTKAKEENPDYAEQMDTFIKEIRGW